MTSLQQRLVGGLVEAAAGGQQARAQERDGIALAPRREQLGRHVERVVVHRVALHAQRHELEQRRAAAAARALDRLLRGAVDGDDVGAVDDLRRGSRRRPRARRGA